MAELSWEKCNQAGSFIISTRPELLEHDFINNAFASEEMYWAKPVPRSQLVTLLANSITLGLYERQPSEPAASPEEEQSLPQKDFAILRRPSQADRYGALHNGPRHRKSGLGKWLVACCHEVIEAHPALRRVLLAASPHVGKPFYARELGMWDVLEEKETVAIMSRKRFKAPGE
ncbi:hypothetical protein D0866_01815 [Hortaea werneckii]|uniref:N-acetyltransferase domain-containing protein n=1 Tax=Hortaea werneckii TaxID=91943 RepID=A0A3M7BIR7_HORWE|nr:hypothetical protein D0866_01815 [Hortaea werneckii]